MDLRLKAFESPEFDRVFGAVASLAGAADEERLDVPGIETERRRGAERHRHPGSAAKSGPGLPRALDQGRDRHRKNPHASNRHPPPAPGGQRLCRAVPHGGSRGREGPRRLAPARAHFAAFGALSRGGRRAVAADQARADRRCAGTEPISPSPSSRTCSAKAATSAISTSAP